MELNVDDKQQCMLETPRGRIMIMGSAYYVGEKNRARDVVVNASFAGVLPARMVGDHRPRGAIGVDCGVGPDAAGIVGIYYLEALNIPAATVDVMVVVGGRKSANTRHLKEVCEEQGTRAYHIEGPAELDAAWFADAERIGLTAGASTPDYSIDEVEARIRELVPA